MKRLKAVEITPDGTMQVISGRNAQGKTSVLDAIWLALGGGTAARTTPRPIRDGEDQGVRHPRPRRPHRHPGLEGREEHHADRHRGRRREVLQPAGCPRRAGRSACPSTRWPSPGSRHVSSATRCSSLVDLDVDLEDLAAQRRRVFDHRTDVGRQRKALGEIPAVDPDLPAVEVSASDLIDQITQAERAGGSAGARACRGAGCGRAGRAGWRSRLVAARRRLQGARQAVAFHQPVAERIETLRAEPGRRRADQRPDPGQRRAPAARRRVGRA
ncbi:AAA family ATPase [Nocardioides sp. W3-2-3]|nr:AAA family ATPase [Nocardioides convexus]